jgi:hypothetical protein
LQQRSRFLDFGILSETWKREKQAANENQKSAHG